MRGEITLREIVEMLLNGKWIIAGVTTLFIVSSAIFSFFVASPKYETTSSVLVYFPDNKDNPVNKKYLEPYVEQVRSNFIVDQIIKKLNLDQKKTSANMIQKNIFAQVVNDTNMLKVRVENVSPEKAALIANIVAYELGIAVQTDSLLNEHVQYEKQLVYTEGQLKITKSQLEEARQQLRNTPEKLITQRTLADDPYLQSVVSDTIKNNNRAIGALQLKNEEINPVFSLLNNKIAELSIEHSRLQSSKEVFEANVSKINTELARIRQVNPDLPQDKLIQEVNQNNAVLITPAVTPTVPVAPNKLLNIIFATFLGVLIGVIIVFIRNYWNETTIPTSKKTTHAV